MTELVQRLLDSSHIDYRCKQWYYVSPSSPRLPFRYIYSFPTYEILINFPLKTPREKSHFQTKCNNQDHPHSIQWHSNHYFLYPTFYRHLPTSIFVFKFIKNNSLFNFVNLKVKLFFSLYLFLDSSTFNRREQIIKDANSLGALISESNIRKVLEIVFHDLELEFPFKLLCNLGSNQRNLPICKSFGTALLIGVLCLPSIMSSFWQNNFSLKSNY